MPLQLMIEQVEKLLTADNTTSRLAWIQANYPQKDDALVQLLRTESYRSERDNPRTALVIAQAVADLAEVWQDRPTAAVALLIEANTRRLLAEHSQALELYQQASDIYQAAGLELDRARTLVGQCEALLYLGRYQEAIAIAEWAIHQFRHVGDQTSLARMLANRGNVYARIGRYNEARHDYGEARALFADIDAPQSVAMLEANEANILINLNDFRQAEGMFIQARSRFAEAGMNHAVAQVEHNLAYLYFAQGNYQQALSTFTGVRSFFAAQGSQVDIAYVDLYRGEIYLALNLWQEALDLARAARPAFAEANMQWEVAQLWLNEAAALAHMHDFSRASRALDQARQIFAAEKNQLWLAVTAFYQATFDWRDHHFAAARTHAQQARQVFGEALLNGRVVQCEALLGEIALAEENLSTAKEHFSQGLTLLQGLDLPAIAYRCHYGLGRVLRLQGEAEAATEHLQQAIALIERLQAAIGAEDYKLAFRSDKLDVYEELILLCMAQQTAAAEQLAFATIERAKARTLLDALARQPVSADASSVEAELLAEMQKLKQELNWYYNKLNTPTTADMRNSREEGAYFTVEITQREQQLSQLLGRWRAPDLASAPRNPISTVTVQQMQAQLQPGVLLLEFYVTGQEVIVFGIASDRVWSYRLPVARKVLAELLAQFRYQINKFNLGPTYRQQHAAILQQGVNESLQRLYQALIHPLISLLDGATTLVIVPHHLLHSLPFHALFDGVQYLIQTKTIAYAPSATVLHHVLSHPVAKPLTAPLVLGIADETIPYAQTEAETVAQLFPAVHLLVGELATVESLLHASPTAAFLHISTHATFRADNPLFSALKLADGWVTVNDIYTLARLAPLVTLSACETGRSQLHVGDELIGLCRGFFSAGVQSLIVSHWAVDDSSTAQFMRYFYHYLQDGMAVYQALRKAQLQLLATHAHPYYWAPFVLMGNPWTQLSPSLAFIQE